MPFNTIYRPRTKRPGRELPVTIHQLSEDLRGPPNNRHGGHEARLIDPGNLWHPPTETAQLYEYSQEEFDAEIERLRAEGKID